MADAGCISIVIPLFRSAATAAELMRLISTWAGGRNEWIEVVLVDDACPNGSAAAFARAVPDGRVRTRILRHTRNRGQFAAIQTGLAHATGDVVAVMDADLQDRPPDLTALLDRLRTWPGIVCAGRSGDYESSGRRQSATAFRLARHVLSHRQIPRDAGVCSVMRRDVLARLLQVADDGEHPLTTAYRAGIPVTSVPVVRHRRPEGTSAYTTGMRWRAAAAALTPLTPLRRPAPLDPAGHPVTELPTDHDVAALQEVPVNANPSHNDYQRTYFSQRPLPRMSVTDGPSTPYVRRHVDAVIAGARLTPDDLVLDVGSGPGKYTRVLAETGYRVEGLDLTPLLIDELRAALPDVPAYVGDVVAPPLELTERYDAIVGFMMLHHLEDLTASFRGIRRMVRTGGRVCFLEPNPYYPGFAVQIALTPGMTFEGEGGIYRLTPRRLHDALSESGFRPRTLTHFGVFPPAVANRTVGQRIEHAMEQLPGWSAYQAFQVITATAE